MNPPIHLERRSAMSSTEVVIEGTLNPDVTLQLDQKPDLSPGRVKVILQPAQLGTPRARGLAEVLDGIRQRQQARGFQGCGAEEIEDGLRQGEDEYEQISVGRKRPASGRIAGWSRSTV
jgi:hypothetical protein